MSPSRSARAAAVAGLAAAVAGALAVPAGAAGAAARVPVVQNLARISVQEAPGFPGQPPDLSASEPDTLVEPDVAASPLNPAVAVAASHEGRFPDGGAVSISHAWTTNGGVTWRHAPVSGLTRVTGGVWDRTSDPVLAFGPDGNVYLSVLALNSPVTDCRSNVLVSRSSDGGATFARPVTAQFTNDCLLFNDKNWLTVDNGSSSPHRGRIYQVWSFFKAASVDQTVRWSDDHGRTWSRAVQMTPTSAAGTQNSQTVVMDDGTVVDTYLDFTFSPEAIEDPRKGSQAAARTAAPQAAGSPGLRIMAVRSTDGGASWTRPTVVATHVGFGPDDVRCCLHSGTVDPVTGRLSVAWISENNRTVLTSGSSDAGRTWSAPLAASRGATAATERVNVDISSYAGRATVSYATRDTAAATGRFWQQQASTSYDGGLSFGPPQSLGPRYDTRYGAFAGAVFPGDYIGSAAVRGRTYLVWPVASAPADPTRRFHQVLYSAVLRP
jgi:hypothetical protein